ncbi:MAG: 4Fe-4S dicluster domain-containing protein, partial [Bacillota bacterium]
VTNIPEDIKDIWNSLPGEKSPAQRALEFIYNLKEVSVILSGMNKIDHIDENIEIASKTKPNSLSKKELETIDKIRNFYKEKIKVNCTKCNYCMPCTVGIDIPEAFNQYNNAFMYDDVESARFHYNILLGKHNKLASKCIECGKCEPKCPQDIKIIERLKEVVDLLE